MRIAVCFSGQIRGFKWCFPKIESHYIKPWGLLPTYFFYGPPDPNFEINEICRTIKYVFEPQTEKTLIEINTDGYNREPNSFSWQWYNVKKSLELALDYGVNYDVYLRIRTDLYPVGKSTFNWNKFEQDVLYVPDKHHWGGVCDRIGFGNRKVMELYSGFYGSEQFKNTNGNSETRLLSYLRSNNIDIKYISSDIIDFCHKNEFGHIQYPYPDTEEKLMNIDNETNLDFGGHNPWKR